MIRILEREGIARRRAARGPDGLTAHAAREPDR